MLDSKMAAWFIASNTFDDESLCVDSPPVNHARMGLRPGDDREEGDDGPPKKEGTGDDEARAADTVPIRVIESKADPRREQHLRN